MNQYHQKTNKSDIPDDCCSLNMGQSNCTFSDNDDRNHVNLQLYDGGITKHYYWGNMAFELSSMKLAKKKTPILVDHDTSQRLGVGTKATFDDKFVLSGTLLDNDTAVGIKADMESGFPFEASLRFDPERTDMEFVKEGNKIDANGNTLKGPGVLFKNTIIMEGSVVTFGALSNCQTELFNKENKMSATDDKLTVNALNASNPDVYDEIHGAGQESGVKDGIKEMQDRQKEFQAAFGDDPEFCLAQLASDVSFADAQTAYIAKLKTAIATKVPETPAKKDASTEDPGKAEFSDGADSGGAPGSNLVGEAKWEAEFNASAALQDEFLADQVGQKDALANYVAFMTNEQKGVITGRYNKGGVTNG